MNWNLNKIIVEENQNLPPDWNSLSASGRIFVEIGFGNGENLEFLAKKYPDVLIVGVEVSQLCVMKGARRALSQGLDNIRIMHGDARFLLRAMFAPETVDRLFMNFPCPWPKTRHAERRVTVPSFARLLNYLLKTGGTFELATDVDWYAEDANETITKTGAFDTVSFEKNPQREYITKYERLWLSMNKDIWSVVLRKNGRVPHEEYSDSEWKMEGGVETNMRLEELAAKLKGAEGKGTDGEGYWTYRDVFLSVERVALGLVITADEGFEQHFYIKLVEKSGGGFTVKVDSVGHPYRTPAMRAALKFALDTARG